MDGLFTVKRAKTNSNLIYLVNKINLKPENYYPHKLVFLLIFLAKWSLRIFRKRFSKLTLFHIPVRAKQTRQHFVTADLQPLVRVTFMVHSSPHYLTILLLTILLVLFNNSSEDWPLNFLCSLQHAGHSNRCGLLPVNMVLHVSSSLSCLIHSYWRWPFLFGAILLERWSLSVIRAFSADFRPFGILERRR